MFPSREPSSQYRKLRPRERTGPVHGLIQIGSGAGATVSGTWDLSWAPRRPLGWDPGSPMELKTRGQGHCFTGRGHRVTQALGFKCQLCHLKV